MTPIYGGEFRIKDDCGGCFYSVTFKVSLGSTVQSPHCRLKGQVSVSCVPSGYENKDQVVLRLSHGLGFLQPEGRTHLYSETPVVFSSAVNK